MGFSKLISPQDKETHIQEIQSEGGFFLDYYIRPEGNREQYTSIVYLEPLDKRNQAAIGYDMFSEPVRRNAMERARDTGEAALSGKVTLVQEIDEQKQAGFLIYVPIYRKNVPLNTIEEKRAALLGYVYSPFRMNDFMKGLFGEKPSGIDIHIYDGDLKQNPPAIQLIYDEMSDHHAEDNSFYHPYFDGVEKLEIAGHVWTMYFYSLPFFETTTKTHTSKIVLLGGLLVSVLLFAFTRSFETARLFETEHKLNQQLHREITEREKVEIALRESEERFDLAMRGSNDGLWDWNIETNEVYFSPRWKEMVGYEIHEIPHHLEEWRSRVHPDDLAQTMLDVEKYLNQQTPIYQNTHRAKHKNGHYVWILDRGIAIWNQQGKPIRMVGTHTDLTHLKQVEAELKELNRDFVTLLENTTDFIYFKDQESRMHFCSQTLAKITGHQHWKEMRGKHDFELFPKDTAQIYYEEELPIFNGEKTFIDTINPYYNLEGKIGWIHTNKWAVFGENGNVVGIFGISRDITERKQMEEELWRLANTDFLTGLMSRRYFMKKIEEEFVLLRNHDISCCSVLMLDLDHFKHINDTYGHAVGDTVLKHFSALLKSNLRQMDVAGRLGGEEFAVILPYIDANEAKQCAERLRNIIANSPIIENDNVISITVSIGISMLRENDRYADTALIRADNALFAAKNNGRNTIQIAA